MPLNPRNWTLLLLRGGSPGRFWILPKGAARVGRAPSNQIQLSDASVSRQHVEVTCGQEGVSIRDLKSRNGVLVNGVPRQKADLQEGDRLEIGVFELQLAGAPPSVSAPTIASPDGLTSETQVHPTDEQGICLPNERRDRDLSALYHVCFWVAEGIEEKDFVSKCLRLLLDAFRAEEVHFYGANGSLELFVTQAGTKPEVRLAAFLARRFQESTEAVAIAGASVAQHQKDVGRFNYLVGPLGSPSAEKEIPFLVLVRRREWEEFDVKDRVLLQAICQQWVRGQSKAVQVQSLRQENARLKVRYGPPVVLGNSAVLIQLREQARRAAATNVTVLLEGETGSGKEVIAQFIHEQSARHQGPFVKLNCAAIPEGLIESELFGHMQGAFTDARGDRRGKFTQADQGTLLFDEIGEMPLSVQAKALRAIENGEIEPLGSEAVVKVDVRIIAATHRDLAEMVSRREFREDLYYRMNVMKLRLPPLREHLEDLEALATHFLDRFVTENGLAEMAFSPEAFVALKRHAWPGNVRELRSVVQRCAVSAEPPLITPANVQQQMRLG